MIEPIMYIGIGFLVAGLLVIGVIPLVHARAVRLTMRRLEALTPLSMAEIQADKDQLRAEFAMSMRRLEMNVEQMKAKTTSQPAEIGKKSEAIGRLKLELGEKTAALFALEAKEKQLRRRCSERSRASSRRERARCTRPKRALAECGGRTHPDQRPLPTKHAVVRHPARRAGGCAGTGRAPAGSDRWLRQREQGAAGSSEQQDRRGRGGAAAARRGARPGRPAGRPRRRTRASAHRADHGSGSSGAPRPGARHPARRARALPDRLRERVRPLAQRSGERAGERVHASRRTGRAGRALPPCDRYRDHREVADRKRAQAVAGRTRQAAARDCGDET